MALNSCWLIGISVSKFNYLVGLVVLVDIPTWSSELSENQIIYFVKWKLFIPAPREPNLVRSLRNFRKRHSQNLIPSDTRVRNISFRNDQERSGTWATISLTFSVKFTFFKFPKKKNLNLDVPRREQTWIIDDLAERHYVALGPTSRWVLRKCRADSPLYVRNGI